MLCINCSKLLKECVAKGLLTEEQLQKIQDYLITIPDTQAATPPAAAAASREVSKGFNPIMVLYYIGALLIISAFGWFMVDQWKALGAGGILTVSIIYALVFVLAGRYLYFKAGYPVAGGLLISCAVGITPIVIYSIQKLLNIWPMSMPGAYSAYYMWINGSWIVIEWATIIVALYAITRVKFSFLVMPAAIALWFFSMDLSEIIQMTHRPSYDVRCWTSIICGLVFLIGGRIVEKLSEGVDYSFWIYLAGILAFWGGMTALPSASELNRFFYFLVNAGLIVTSLYLNRKTFAVFGAMGVFGYIGHLAWTVFKNSIMFPFVMVFIGVLMIWGAVMYQKNYSRIRSTFKP